MKNDLIATRGVCLANSSYLRDFFALNKVEIHLETALKEITERGIIVESHGESKSIAADCVILSVGYIPTPLANKSKHVHIIGDCAEIGNLRTVIWGAWDVAMKL